MKTILKLKWPIVIGLIAITVAMFLLAPNLTEQAEKAGTFQLSEEASSQLAANILADAGADEQTISLVVPLENELDESMRKTLGEMVSDIEELGDPITSVLNPVESSELEDQLISKDQKTILMPITVDGTDEEVNKVADQIRETIIPEDITAYITGEAIINNDVNISAQEGLKRTEVITVVLIFGLLLAVFRSIVTPFVPLAAVGISYLLSQSIVAFFIDWFGFPVSNYTQIFLVAILFGIGTDYCILLLSRYKEELSAGRDVEESIINTYKTAGRTLLISGVAVFIGFFAIGFADFPIFKSAVAVAVGIFVLLIVLFTVVPFFMALLKEKLFWPAKKSASHHDSVIWIWMSKLSINRPLLSMLVVAIITVPLLFTYDNELSFNTVDEIGSEYESVKGLRAIEEGFGKGDSLPVQVIVKSDEELTDEAVVPYFESLSREIEKIDGVDAVRSVTRPTGEVIEELYVDEQLGLLADGVGEARDGVSEIQQGLAGTAGALSQPQPGQANAPGAGMAQLTEGIAASSEGLAEIETGLTEAVDTMQEMSDSETIRDTGMFIPEGTLDSEEFAQVLDRYAFADGTGMIMEVVLSEDPYSHEAIDITADIKAAVERGVIGTPLEDAQIAFGGISSINSDLQDVSSSDFTSTVIIMLVSLFVVLAILFRSLIMPLYMIGSLLLTYFTSIAIAELIFVNGLGFDGVSWAVPFFGFVMLVALGVDYSIFLLDRFREESGRGLSVKEALRISMAKMGTVIITAAIILAGTFGAMMPSGVLSLVQIATIVITGLLLYGLIILPLLIPAISVSFGRGVWWPFGNKNNEKE